MEPIGLWSKLILEMRSVECAKVVNKIGDVIPRDQIPCIPEFVGDFTGGRAAGHSCGPAAYAIGTIYRAALPVSEAAEFDEGPAATALPSRRFIV